MVKAFFENGATEQYYKAIEKEDMTKPNQYFNRAIPEILLREVNFIIAYYMRLRGWEWIKRLQKRD